MIYAIRLEPRTRDAGPAGWLGSTGLYVGLADYARKYSTPADAECARDGLAPAWPSHDLAVVELSAAATHYEPAARAEPAGVNGAA